MWLNYEINTTYRNNKIMTWLLFHKTKLLISEYLSSLMNKRHKGINRKYLAEQTCVSLCIRIAVNRQCDKEESYLHLKFPFLCVFTYATTTSIVVPLHKRHKFWPWNYVATSVTLVFLFLHMFSTYSDTSSVSQNKKYCSKATAMIFIFKYILLFIYS